MIQRAQGAFRSMNLDGIPGINSQDIAPNVLAQNPGWTAGATIIDVPQLQPPATQPWKVLGFAVTAGLFLETWAAQTYGKWGRIVAGLIFGPGAVATGNQVVPFVGSALDLPLDASQLTTLWDPNSDPQPPTSPAPGVPARTLPLTTSLMLPNPLDLPLGSNIGIGLWTRPSLLGSTKGGVVIIAKLNLWNCQYTIFYDDGKPLPVGL